MLLQQGADIMGSLLGLLEPSFLAKGAPEGR